MPRITIEISQEDADDIRRLVERMNLHPDIAAGTSHGKVTAAGLLALLALLAEDAALAERRPGSWEGANMSMVLQSHGYAV